MKVPAGSLIFSVVNMHRAVLIVSSGLIGIASFVFILSFAGFENIIAPFRKFSLFYLVLFLLATWAVYLVHTLRWYVVVRYQGMNVPFLELLKLKLIGTSVNYLTPASGIGGEPVKALVFKKKFRLAGRSAFSSILIESIIGISIDVLLIAVAMVTAFFFFTLPPQSGNLALILSVVGSIIAIALYASLFLGLRPFSVIVRACFGTADARLLKRVVELITGIEDALVDFLCSRKKGVAKAALISLLSWPLTFLQYKFALLAIGAGEVPFIIILLSIIALFLSNLIPIPAAFGVQEAGQFSVFSIIAMPSVGIALSLIIRFKDLLTVLIGLTLLSHEGLSIFEVFKKKK